jgi:hypothetical protein
VPRASLFAELWFSLPFNQAPPFRNNRIDPSASGNSMRDHTAEKRLIRID